MKTKAVNLKNLLYSGDLLLFSGKSLFSHSIRTFTNSRWSHCGMVINDKHKSPEIWDVSKKTYGGEVALYNAEDRIALYDGDIAYRPLQQANGARGFSSKDAAAFQPIKDNLLGRPYETNKLELMKAAFDPKIFGYELAKNHPDLSSIFCGELLAETYQRLGLLQADLPANEYVPADFDKNHVTSLEKGYIFGPEIILKTSEE